MPVTYTSSMARLLQGIQTQLLDPASGLGITQAVITRREQPREGLIMAQIYPYAVQDSDGDAQARVDVALYTEFADEEDAVLGLYEKASRCAHWLKRREDRIATDVALSISASHQIGEAVSIDGEGEPVLTGSFVVVTIEPEWLEDIYGSS